VRRLASVIIVAVLTISASGATSLIIPEPCTGYEFSEIDDDGLCPPTCVTCGCCAQAAEPLAMVASTSQEAPTAAADVFRSQLLKTDPRDILHVPKARLL
jgi:hypothetical protein